MTGVDVLWLSPLINECILQQNKKLMNIYYILYFMQFTDKQFTSPTDNKIKQVDLKLWRTKVEDLSCQSSRIESEFTDCDRQIV